METSAVSIAGIGSRVEEVSANAEIVDALQRSATLAADDGAAIAAYQWIGDRLLARRAIEFLRIHRYFAAAIDSTVMLFVFSSSVPVTVTFLAANFSGVF